MITFKSRYKEKDNPEATLTGLENGGSHHSCDFTSQALHFRQALKSLSYEDSLPHLNTGDDG